MTLYEQYKKHQQNEFYNAARAVQCLQSGREYQARIAMDLAATERHLAFELLDTWEISGVALDSALRALAAVYADHPDYRKEWAPMSG